MNKEIEIIDMKADNYSLEELSNKKDVLLNDYKALAIPLEYAQNDFEKNLIEEKRVVLAREIKYIAARIDETKEV